MANLNSLSKRLQIDKANETIVIVMAVAAFVAVFSLLSSKALISQAGYQNRVITAKKAAYSQLQTDVTAVKSLNDSYQAFVSQPQNLIGGNPTGNGANDGDNAKLVLDALPSQYDFPALATAMNNLVSSQGLSVTAVTGQDESLSIATTGQATANPTPTVIPVSFSATGSYQQVQNILNTINNSIRPIQIQSISLSGSDNSMSLSITAQTFYQPGKTFTIGSETVK